VPAWVGGKGKGRPSLTCGDDQALFDKHWRLIGHELHVGRFQLALATHTIGSSSKRNGRVFGMLDADGGVVHFYMHHIKLSRDIACQCLYADFTVKHFHEQLTKRHGYMLGYTVTKVHLHRAGLVRPALKRSAHRKKRARRPLVGMMLHQDGSRHAWLEGLAPLDLIVTLDDATSEIYSMFLVAEEGTASTFQGLREVVERQGLFCALYTDRGSHYFYTPEAGEKVSKTQLTQVGRALRQLRIEHIPAYSPEARGRSERAFRTLQDRLPKELRLAGITTLEAANAWLRDTFVAEHNRAFKIAPLEEGSAFLGDPSGA
jgi:hypothetical protein